MSQLPPFLVGADGYCYAASFALVENDGLEPWYGRVDATGHAVPGTEPPGQWCGQTVVCIASGPSLTREDCQAVQKAGLATVVANDSFKAAPFAEAIFAMDHGWWQQHMHEIHSSAQLWTTSVPAAQEFGLRYLVTHADAANSGARAVELAIAQGAGQVLLLGFDCSLSNGVHWHGEHVRTGNPNESTVGRWHGQFQAVASKAGQRGVQVVNCSRETAIECFPREELRRVLDRMKKVQAHRVP